MDAFNGVGLDYERVVADLNANAQSSGVDADQNTTPGSCTSRAKQDVKVGLPLSCDPPGPNNPPKQLVWIVSRWLFSLLTCFRGRQSASDSVRFAGHDVKVSYSQSPECAERILFP